jgi:hypothetical protein
MATVSPELIRIRERFERTRSAQDNFVLSLPAMLRKQSNRIVAIGKTRQEQLCEMAFAILFTAREQFLECAFEHSVVDAPLASFRSRHRVLVTDRDTAHDLIRGNRKYVEWADIGIVRERAKVFFKNGEPFESSLSAMSDDVRKMRIIRNRCVHLSQHAVEQYKKMIREVFGSGKQIPPGRLLLDMPPSGLSSAANAQSYGTVFQLYGAILATAASQIVPEKRK